MASVGQEAPQRSKISDRQKRSREGRIERRRKLKERRVAGRTKSNRESPEKDQDSDKRRKRKERSTQELTGKGPNPLVA